MSEETVIGIAIVVGAILTLISFTAAVVQIINGFAEWKRRPYKRAIYYEKNAVANIRKPQKAADAKFKSAESFLEIPDYVNAARLFREAANIYDSINDQRLKDLSQDRAIYCYEKIHWLDKINDVKLLSKLVTLRREGKSWQDIENLIKTSEIDITELLNYLSTLRHLMDCKNYETCHIIYLLLIHNQLKLSGYLKNKSGGGN